MEPQIQYCTTADGVSIAYARAGSGRPVVVVPNMWGNIGLFYHVFPEFITENAARNRETILFDSRGSGASQRDVAQVSLETRVIDLEAVADHLRLDPFVMMGISHGGPPAIAYAVRHPERVSHLVLPSTYASGAEYYARAPVMRAFAAMEQMVVDQWEFYTRAAANAVLGYSDPGMADRLTEFYRESTTPQMLVRYREASSDTDVTALLDQVACPTLVLDDKNSALRVEQQSRELASKIPGARLVSFAGRGITGGVMMGSAIGEFLEGSGSAAVSHTATPSAFRSVLFTDLVGHVDMMQRLGDTKGRDVLREHERITREALKQHGGAELKTMGDGFMASFTSVTAAMECAIALQRAFADRNETTPHRLDVRVGLNAGEPIEEEGDLFGASVILASRVAALAGAGEILVPEPVRHLLSGKDFVFADRGEHILKGFEDAVRVFEVRWRL
ncbi:MAG: adenylate/guanylate cyclase domain-containing protein [Dehalococcoidia bacterium]